MEVIYACLKFFCRFHVEIYIIAISFAFCLERRKYFWIRFAFTTAVFISLPYLLPIQPGETIYYWSYLKVGDWVNFTWFIEYVFIMLILAFLFKLNFKETLFFGTASYTMQHLLKRMIFLICNFASVSISSQAYYVIGFFVTIPMLALYYFLFIRRIKRGESINTNNIYILIIAVTTVAIFCFLSSYDDTFSRGNISIRIYTMLLDVVLLALLFGIFEKSKLSIEKESMSRMLHEMENDMELSKKNVDAINLKCHDLKHQIDGLKIVSDEQRNEKIMEIEKEITFYDNVAKIGNAPLDLILTKKSLYCEKHQIQLNYQIDPSAMIGIDDVDVYTLLGNILDNAIEALIQVTDKEKRIISLKIVRKNDFIAIHEENYLKEKLTFKEGFPETTKSEKAYHGFGLRSIDYLAKKYKGYTSVIADNEIFALNLLIPVISNH
ncbi:MAG: GHKL domain-containing protein [Bacilli bacterium]